MTAICSGIFIAQTRANIAAQVFQDQASLGQSYARLTPWQKVLVARHPERPHCLDYIAGLISDFQPLAGDRAFGFAVRPRCRTDDLGMSGQARRLILAIIGMLG